MSDPRDAIKKKLFEEEQLEKDLEMIAEGIIDDFIQGGKANRLKKVLAKDLDKALSKDNKSIIKGLELLKKAYGNRVAKLHALKSKIDRKIDANRALSDAEKAEMKKSITDGIADNEDMLRRLNGEESEIKDEIQDTQKATQEPAQAKPQDSDLPPLPDAETLPEPPTEEPEAATEEPKGPPVNDILAQYNSASPEKQDKFKSRLRTLLSRNGPRIVKGALEMTANIKEDVVNEKFNLKHGLGKAVKTASNTILQSLRRDKDLQKQYDGLSRKKKERVNRIVLSTALKMANKSLGDDFFTSEETPKQEEPKKKEEPVIPDDAELEKTTDEPEPRVEPEIPEEPSAEPIIPDDAELEDPSEPDAVQEPEPDEVTDEPEDEPQPTAMDTLSDMSVENSSSFLKEKGLIDDIVSPLFDELSSDGKKKVIDSIINLLNKISTKHKQGINEKLTPADLGLPDDFDLGDIKSGIIKNIRAAVTNIIKKVHEEEIKAKEPAPEPVEEPKAEEPTPEPVQEPKAKEKVPEKPKAAQKPAPKKKVAPKPETKSKEDPNEEPFRPKKGTIPSDDVVTADFNDAMSKSGLIDDLNDIGGEFASKMKAKYARRRYELGHKEDSIVNDIAKEIDNKLFESKLLKENIRGVFSELERSKIGGFISGDAASELSALTIGDIVSYTLEKQSNNEIKPEEKPDSEKKPQNKNTGIPDVTKSALGDVASQFKEATSEKELENFRNALSDLAKKSKNYGMVKEIDKENNMATIQPMKLKRGKINPDKVVPVKSGSTIEIPLNQILSIEVPFRSFPRELAERLVEFMGISAALAFGAYKAAQGLASQADPVDDV